MIPKHSSMEYESHAKDLEVEENDSKDIINILDDSKTKVKTWLRAPTKDTNNEELVSGLLVVLECDVSYESIVRLGCSHQG